jgi:uncharacterized protein YbaR (Trm112 family)
VIDKELLAILVCPDTRRPLRLADDQLLDRLNEAIAAGRVSNRGGQPVGQPLAAGLVREDGGVVYPIVDEIPVLLVDEAIPLDQIE